MWYYIVNKSTIVVGCEWSPIPITMHIHILRTRIPLPRQRTMPLNRTFGGHSVPESALMKMCFCFYSLACCIIISSLSCRVCFCHQISDDDRMSLTTAVSDEEDGESVMASPYKAKATGTAAASFNCTGAVRKAG